MATATKTADPVPATSSSTPQNMVALFHGTVRRLGTRVALRQKTGGIWQETNWSQYGELVDQLALGLRSLGVEKGDRVSLLANTRREWVLSDLAILSAGGVTVPIYPSVLSDDVAYILNDSGAKILFCEDSDQLEKATAAKDADGVEHYVVFSDARAAQEKSGLAADKVLSFEDLIERGKSGDLTDLETIEKSISADDLLTLVYTSGTTGKPKGVMLSHGNVVSEARALDAALGLGLDDSTLLFLPLAHIFARVLHLAQVSSGYVMSFAESIEKVKENCGETHPTFLASVPRVLEKFHAAVGAKVEAQSGLKKKLVTWALQRTIDANRRARKGGSSGGIIDAFAARLTGKIRAGLLETLGGKIEFFISGGAPLARDIGLFFDALGFTVLEGYGLTETTAATHVNRRDANKLGTVGQALPDVEVRIAPDGEILVRGPNIMTGYYNREEATKEAIQADGRFHTCDIGKIDDDGFLSITDRKKDLIVTAGGKNISPQNIENLMKTDRYISQFMCYGDQKKYLVSLVTLDQAAVETWAKNQGLSTASWESLTATPDVRNLIQESIDAKNTRLPKFETIKYFHILPEDFSIEGGELTPTLKLKRKVLVERHKDLLESLYKDAPAS